MTKQRKKHYKSITKRSFLSSSAREVARRGGGSEPYTARNIPGCRKVLSPTACGRSPLAEGAKWGGGYTATRRIREADPPRRGGQVGGYGRRFTVTFGVFGSVSRSE